MMSTLSSSKTASSTLQNSLQWMADHMGPTAIVALPTQDVTPSSTSDSELTLADVRNWLSDHMGPTAIVPSPAHMVKTTVVAAQG